MKQSKSSKGKAFETLQRIGKCFFLPISVLPFAGILLGVGASFTNQANIANLGWEAALGQGTFLNGLFTVFNGVGSVVFGNLPLLFAVALAIGMAKGEKATAAFASAIAFLTMNATINKLLVLSGKVMEDGTIAEGVAAGSLGDVLGMTTLQMGVFGGIILGLLVVVLHNKYYRIELPAALSFFGGTRFVPIVSVAASIALGAFFFVTWPFIQIGIGKLGDLVVKSGYFGTFLYGVIERALIPFGLHHVFYVPIWSTALGGQMEIGGKLVQGAQNIYFAQLADPNTQKFSMDAVRFLVGKYPFMLGGLPGAALAMYHTVPKIRREEVKGLYFGAGFTSFLTGITEPIEFTFLFLAPKLFGIHVIGAGLAFLSCHLLGIAVGATFSDGFIDFSIFGLLQGSAKTNWPYLVLLALVYFGIYYAIFRLLITKWDVKVPGRDEGEAKLFSKADFLEKKNAANANDQRSEMITRGLGGIKNIETVDCCATRLRLTVKDPAKVNKDMLKQTNASGVLVEGKGVQVIYGPKVNIVKSYLEDFLEENKNDPDLQDIANTALVEEVKEEMPLVNENATSQRECKYDQHPLAAVTGELIDITKVKDQVFSSNMLGVGYAIIPSEKEVYAPIDGTISLVFETKHAIGISGTDGSNLLVHMGIDTTKLDGEGFDIKCFVGQEVKKGDLLALMDIDLIKSKGYDTVIPFIYTDESEISIKLAEGPVKAKEANRIELL